MPTPISEIVAHRLEMLRETVRDTPERVVVAMDSESVRHAYSKKDVDLTTQDGIEAFISRLQLNSLQLSSSNAECVPKIEKIGRRKTENVIIARGPLPHRSTCWVHSSYRGYRSAFKSFIKKIYGNVDWGGFEKMHVDHLFSRGQKRMGNKYLRLEAIDGSVNSSHGATVEKKQARQIDRCTTNKRGLSVLSVLKLYNLNPPRSHNDGERLEEIRKVLRADGWSTRDVSQSIENLLNLYSRNMDSR